jgi:hypothetical protein
VSNVFVVNSEGELLGLTWPVRLDALT